MAGTLSFYIGVTIDDACMRIDPLPRKLTQRLEARSIAEIKSTFRSAETRNDEETLAQIQKYNCIVCVSLPLFGLGALISGIVITATVSLVGILLIIVGVCGIISGYFC